MSDILLMECFLAGFEHYAAGKCWNHLRIGEELALVREPANPHDSRAVRVDWHGATLGYVPREANFALAQLLDRGEGATARIARKNPAADPRTRMLLEVRLSAPAQPGAQSLKPGAIVTGNQLLQGLAWMLAGKAIAKAKGSVPNTR